MVINVKDFGNFLCRENKIESINLYGIKFKNRSLIVSRFIYGPYDFIIKILKLK